jgi:hypothetical protein
VLDLVTAREFAGDVLIGAGQNLDAPTVRKLDCLKSHHLQSCINSLLNRSIACHPSPSLDTVAGWTRLSNFRTWLTPPGCLPFLSLGTGDTTCLLCGRTGLALGDGRLGLLTCLLLARRGLSG